MNTIENQAKYYADQIKRTDQRTIYFYPLRKTMSAASNRFRLLTLRALLGTRESYMLNQTQSLDWLQRHAIEQGYTLIDYEPLISEELAP